MHDRFYYLASKRLTGTASISEEQELENLLNEDQELKQLYHILFSKQPTNDQFDIEQAEQAFATHFVKMQLTEQFNSTEEIVIEEEKKESGKEKRKVIYWITAIAACLILFLGSWYLITYGNSLGNNNTNGIAKNEVFTKKGSKSKIILPDGSLVWLNADSKISYSGDFQGETREMQLTGEAYFDVKKDNARPFIIHTNAIDVRVLGTAFNVRSYPSEKTTETSLIRGSVEVILHDFPEKKPIILKANQKLTVKNVTDDTKDSIRSRTAIVKQSGDVAVFSKIHFNRQDSTVVESSWTENKLIFDDESFERVVANIERWYNVEFVIKNSRIKSMHFTADFENKSLSQVLEALSFALKFKYHIEDNRIIIK
jgi:transmembrane sensor